MPRYFFNLYDHVRDIDDEGVELSSPDAARVQAVIYAGDYVSEHPDMVWDGRRLAVEVRDETGVVLLNVVITAEDPNA